MNLSKRFFVVVLTMLVASGFMKAQTAILFNDDFATDTKLWYTYYNEPKIFKYQRNAFVINSVDDYETVNQSIPLDEKKDFEIELEMSFPKFTGNEVGGISIKDNQDPLNAGLAFVVGANYAYAIVGEDYSGKKVYKSATRIPFTNIKKPFLLTIKKVGDISSFFINDKLAVALKNVRYPGNALGFEGGMGVLYIHRFTVKQDHKGINLPPNLSQENKPEFLDKTINSLERALTIHLSADGQTMYIDVRAKEDIYNPLAYGCDDIYYTTKDSKGKWLQPKPMPQPITGPENNDLISISADNTTLFLSDTACASSNVCYYTSHLTGNGWSKLKRMPVHDAYNYSSVSNVVISADGKTIIYSLATKTSLGVHDMYVSRLLKDSTWSAPVSIGTTLNSLGTDSPCFIASDNKTLYYATDGKIGYGDMDTFVTRRLDDTWLNWSEPENLGPIINSDGWDSNFTMDAKGEYAYYYTSPETKKIQQGYYRIKLPKEIKPAPVVVVKGRVLNAKTQTPINATLYYEILPEGKEAGVARSNPKTGEYKLILPYGKQYGYRAEAKGYITVNENFDLVDEKDYIELEKDLLLAPIEIGQTIKLNNIFFVQSKSELLSSSYPELNRLAAILKDNPSISIELRGYTDNIGDPKKNILLSEDRVNVVRAYLINRGIAASRITGKGMGGVNPVTTDTSEEARKMNRRVEFVILSK